MPDSTYEEQKLIEFLERLSSREPIPGGGAAVAIVSSFTFALGAMVASLSQGERFQEVKEKMKGIEEDLKAKMYSFLRLAQEDELAFQELRETLRLPRGETLRSDRLLAAAKKAVNVPLELVNNLSSLYPVFKFLLEKGNRNLLSDTGIACLFAASAIQASVLNALINLTWVTDKEFYRETLSKVEKASQCALDFQALAQVVRNSLEGGQ